MQWVERKCDRILERHRNFVVVTSEKSCFLVRHKRRHLLCVLTLQQSEMHADNPVVAMLGAMTNHPRPPSFPSAPAAHEEDRILANALLQLVYGCWKGSAEFGFAPRPLPPGEAGVVSGGQSRHLWTDAIGVMNFCTEAARCAEAGDAIGRRDALRAGEGLAECMTKVLGQPSSHDVPMTRSSSPPFTGGTASVRYKGLRCGKRLAARVSDPGGVLDGMYFHYVYLWVFALARLGAELFSSQDAEEKVRGTKILVEASDVVCDVHPLFVERNETNTPIGVRWKINVDGTPIKGLPETRLSQDAVSGAVAWTCLCSAIEIFFEENVLKEISAHSRLGVLQKYATEMRSMAVQLRPAVSLDSKGWGLQMWEAQWLPATPLSMNHPLSPAGFVGSETVETEPTSASSDVWFQFAETLRNSQSAPGGDVGEETESAGYARRHETGVAFRAHIAWLGARVGGKRNLAQDAGRFARDAARAELLKDAAREKKETTTDCFEIDGRVAANRVTLVAALDPLAFYRRANEPGLI